MALQNAASLWWLLPLFAVIILLYLLRMRRRDFRVPAVFLWPQVTADVRANAPIQRLRFSWLLVLQLLAVLCVIVALANPLHRARGLYGRATVVVLDGSAPMNATDIAPTRFEDARRRIAAIVGGMGAGDRLALVEAAGETRVVCPLTNDRARLQQAVHDLRGSDAPPDMAEALRLAGALAGHQPGGRILVLSDGDFPAVSDFAPGSAEMVYSTIGRSGNNVALTALDSARLPDGRSQLFAAVRNESSSTADVTVAFTVDSHLTDARKVSIAAGQTSPQTLTIPAGARRADVTINSTGDYLPADDHAALYLDAAHTIHVLLVSSGDLFLERSLALLPSVVLDRTAALPATEAATKGGSDSAYDLVIFDGVPPTPVKAPAVLSFSGVSPGMPVTQTGMSIRPRAVAETRDDPVMRFVDLSPVLIDKSARVRVRSGGRVLVDGSDGPLVVAASAAGRRSLYVAWSPLDSDFPLRVAFPIFISNAVAWLTADTAREGGGINARTGHPILLTVPPSAQSLQLRAPDGTTASIDSSTGAAVIRTADRAGDYAVSGDGVDVPIAVNVLDETASRILPQTSINLAGANVVARTSSSVMADLWRPLALLALVVLGLEWWVFARSS